MNNADRINNILDTLTAKGPMRFASLQCWLGNPYSFNKNVAALIDQGLIVEQIQHGPMGCIYKLSLA